MPPSGLEKHSTAAQNAKTGLNSPARKPIPGTVMAIEDATKMQVAKVQSHGTPDRRAPCRAQRWRRTAIR